MDARVRRPGGAAAVVVVAVLAGGTLLAGCGDKAPSKQAFLAKADPVCKRAGDAAALLSAPTSLAGVKDLALKVSEGELKTAAQLDRLDKPKGQSGRQVREFVAAMRSAAAAGKAVAGPVDGNDIPGIERTANEFVAAAKKADDLARAAGSAECAHGEAAAAVRLGEKAGPLAKEAYIAKVDGLCSAARGQVLALERPTNDDEAAGYLAKTLEIGEKLLRDVKAVPAPAFDKPKLDEMLAKWDESMAATRRLKERIDAEDEDGTEEVGEEIVDLGLSFRGKASAYGFHQCGQG